MVSVTSPFDIGVAGVEYAVGFCCIAQFAVLREDWHFCSSKPLGSAVVEVAHLADPENWTLLRTLEQDNSLVPFIIWPLFFNIVLI